MANILLIANLNCDHILKLNRSLEAGSRYHYQNAGKRLGGGGANTGIGLVWAGHDVALVTQVGGDAVGDWLVESIDKAGINCNFIHRHQQDNGEVLLIMTPDGERTIIRPEPPQFNLTTPPDWSQWDALYINTSDSDPSNWAQTALAHCLVIAQLAKDNRHRHCHILITSKADMTDRSELSPWEYALSIAGEQLQAFIVTDGKLGATLYQANGQQVFSTQPVPIVDTTGAGDAYAAGVIHGLMQGQSIANAMTEAAHWATFAITTPSSIPGEKLRHYLSQKKQASE